MNTSIDMAGPLPLSVAADLQDHLMTACNDLDRLQDLLAGACDVLMDSFRGAAEQLIEHRRGGGEAVQVLERVQQQLGSAVTALQFQDMTSQLIQHTHRRLRNCADRLACEVFAGDEDEGVVEQAPLRPNPVTQAEMDAGSIDLF
jgi:RNAse (barnase) inhibitor barstar